MTIKANGFTSTSDDLIPDGTIVDVTDTPMDFRKPRCVGDDIDSDYPPIVLAGGYDHNYVLDKPEGTFAKVAEVTEKGKWQNNGSVYRPSGHAALFWKLY